MGQKSSLTQLVNWRGLYILHGAQRKKRCIGKGTSSSLNAPQLKRTCTRDGEKSVQRACALDYPGEQLRCVCWHQQVRLGGVFEGCSAQCHNVVYNVLKQ